MGGRQGGWGLGDRAGAVGGTRRESLEGPGLGWGWNGGLSLYPICLPALQVAEIQKIELPVILGMIDGVHILGEVEVAHTCFPPPPLPHPSGSHLPACRSWPNAPIAPPHGSAAHCSRTGRRRSRRSHLWGRRWAGSLSGKGVGNRLGVQGKVKVTLCTSVLGS